MDRPYFGAKGYRVLDRAQRDFFWLLVRRDLKVRYAGSTLGGLWNLIHPLMLIAIYMTIFSTIMRDRFGGGGRLVDYGEAGSLNYGVHLVAGLIPWLLFSDVVIRSTGVLIENGNLLKKVSFPPIVLFGTVLFNAFLIHGASLLALFGLLALTGQPVPLIAPAALGVMALLGVAGVGIGMILAGLNVFFRDIGQALQVVIQLLFWFNPIVYYREMILNAGGEGGLAGTLAGVGRVLLHLNPLERFISATQSLFGAAGGWPSASDWVIVLLFPAACLALGWVLIRRMLPDVRDCL